MPYRPQRENARCRTRRNAYISAIDLDTGKTLWRSPALGANARTYDHTVVAQTVGP